MQQRRQHGTPFWVTSEGGTRSADPFVRIELKPGADDGDAYSEAWLQSLVFDQPGILPMLDIEPGFDAPVPVCTELPTPVGYADNLLVTPSGQLVLVECKLWRNPESRRKVLTQVMDYASCFSRWSYEDLEQAVRNAQRPGGDAKRISLWELVAEVSDLEERDFIDAVSRNLRLGRVLLLIVGDGIDEGVERLAGLVQAHAGLHYAIALVELALFKRPNDSGMAAIRPTCQAGAVELGHRPYMSNPRSCVRPQSRVLESRSLRSPRSTLSLLLVLSE